jgi:hypothetical protein
MILVLVGISTTLWMSHSRFAHTKTPQGDPWYVLHPENFESGVIQYMQALARTWLKWFLIWTIHFYRKLSEKVTVKQVLKKKIRGFLYEHTHDTIRHPSEFWNKVRTTTARSKKINLKEIKKSSEAVENEESL